MIVVDSAMLEKLIAVVEPSPEECCGFFLGQYHDMQCTIIKSVPVINSTKGNKFTNFSISSQDYIMAERLADEENLDLVGVYHTHPNRSAIPSDYDFAMALPCILYFILSVVDKRFAGIRSWELDENLQFTEKRIVFVQSLIK
jgi:proteasome lid subunit RPN8/RPN11